MGNRAIITTPERNVGLYVHWNGGRDTIEPLLRYCELQGYRPPSADSYGFARMCQVLGNFFGGSLSVGIDAYTTDVDMDPGDNGIYVIDGWRIVGRMRADYDEEGNCRGTRPIEECEEQREYDFYEMLRTFDNSMPEDQRLGEVLDAADVPTESLKEGDSVLVRGISGWERHTVMGFAEKYGKVMPYIDMYDHDGDWTWNPNNFIEDGTVLV